MTAGFAIAHEGQPPRWGDQIAALNDERIEALPQNERLGSELNFAAVVGPIKVIRDLLVALAWQSPDYEPLNLAGEVSSHMAEVLRVVDTIEAFTATENPEARRASLITNVNNERSWFVEKVAPFIRADAVGAAAAYADLIARRHEVAKAAEEAQQALATIREAAGEKGTSDLARYFETQAKEHRTASETMLRAAIAGVGALFVVGAAFVFWEPFTIRPTTDLVEYLRQLIPRLFLLGIIAYAIRFATRNYTVNKHLQVSNEQRANILRTFPTLIASGQNDVQKDRMAVILAQAAVTNIDSGYLQHAEDKGLDGSALAAIELLRR